MTVRIALSGNAIGEILVVSAWSSLGFRASSSPNQRRPVRRDTSRTAAGGRSWRPCLFPMARRTRLPGASWHADSGTLQPEDFTQRDDSTGDLSVFVSMMSALYSHQRHTTSSVPRSYEAIAPDLLLDGEKAVRQSSSEKDGVLGLHPDFFPTHSRELRPDVVVQPLVVDPEAGSSKVHVERVSLH